MIPEKRLALYPGTFDPITYGHVDIIKKALRIFDEVELAVGVNVSKAALLSLEQRLALIRECTSEFQGVSVSAFEGLVVEHARKRGAIALVRGVRQVNDFEYEMRMYFANRRLNEDLETVFFAPDERHALVSASIVREIHRWGGELSSFVPPPVVRVLEALRNSN